LRAAINIISVVSVGSPKRHRHKRGIAWRRKLFRKGLGAVKLIDLVNIHKSMQDRGFEDGEGFQDGHSRPEVAQSVW
jgi:hypothetical protein